MTSHSDLQCKLCVNLRKPLRNVLVALVCLLQVKHIGLFCRCRVLFKSHIYIVVIFEKTEATRLSNAIYFLLIYVMSSYLIETKIIFNQRRSMTERGGCFQRRLFVRQFVVNTITSDRLTVV